jgi:hypothetical protein
MDPGWANAERAEINKRAIVFDMAIESENGFLAVPLPKLTHTA